MDICIKFEAATYEFKQLIVNNCGTLAYNKMLSLAQMSQAESLKILLANAWCNIINTEENKNSFLELEYILFDK